jgi:hypothetical protein
MKKSNRRIPFITYKTVGGLVAVIGVLMTLNALVCGPRAFGLGWSAVIGCSASGLVMVGVGLLLWNQR